jgi:protein Mpv17
VNDAVTGRSSATGVDTSGNQPGFKDRASLGDEKQGAMPTSSTILDGAEIKKKLNVTNTAIKFALDQTFGAAANTVAFIAGIALLRGQSFASIQENIHAQFWPMIFAGQKLWPAVSVLSFTVVPFEHRTLFGSVVGLFWGIYLSLVAGGKK